MMKNQIKGSLLIGQDNPKRRASRNTRSELYYNQILTIEEICAKVDNITNHDVKRISTHMFDPGNIGITLVGPNASSLREYSLI